MSVDRIASLDYAQTPVEWSLGVSRNRAANWRPDVKLWAGGAFMLSMAEPIGPTREWSLSGG